MRVFFDTNVLVSSFASRGLCAELFELVLLEHELIVGRNVLLELTKTLRQKLKLPAEHVAEIAEFVSGEGSRITSEIARVGARLDPADALVAREALAGRADIFVTGDAALLRAGPIESLRIVSPRQLWELLRTGETNP